MVAVLRRPTRGRDAVTDAVQEPPKPSPTEAATDDSFATAKHYICTALGVVMAVHFYSAYVQNTALIGCLLYTSPSPRDGLLSRMPSSA